jgi:hypothetical protein
MNANKILPFDVDDPEVKLACLAVARLLTGFSSGTEARRTLLAVLIAAIGEKPIVALTCHVDFLALAATVLTGTMRGTLFRGLERVQTTLDDSEVKRPCVRTRLRSMLGAPATESE